MSASAITENGCRSCGAALTAGARFCASCGAPASYPPLSETVPRPVAHEGVVRWLRIPARFVLLCLGFAALGASIGLFATGSRVWGIVLLLLAASLLAALGAATRRSGDGWIERSSRVTAAGRAHAATVAEVWRTRLDAALSGWRMRSRLDAIAVERGPALQALGDAVWREDAVAEHAGRQRLAELEQKRKRIEGELAARLADADERIRRARLPVQETVMVSPNEPSPPYPPPDEGNPPQPAEVPEPYPPPDEGTPPTPAPDPGRPESE